MKKFLKDSVILAAAVSVIILIINKLTAVYAGIKNYLPSDNGHIYKWKYGDIYYTKSGKGKPVLLVHDLDAASSSHEWNRVVKKLSAGHTVYTLDLIGCGHSDKPNLTYTNFLFVQLLNDFIKNIVGKRCSVVGTGDSFSFVVMACRMEPELYDKLIGVSPTDLAELAKCPGKSKNLIKLLIESPIFGTFIYNFAVNRYHIRDNLSNIYFYKGHMVSQELVNSYYYSAHLCGGDGKFLFASIKSYYTNINITSALKLINNSIFLIGGKEHPFISDVIDDYKIFNPSIESALIPNSCCLPQLEMPRKFSELLNIVLDS